MKQAPNELKFVYLKSQDDPLHVVTAVGFVKVGDFWEVQIARCKKPDHFCKHIARSIIRGRYKKYGAIKRYNEELCANMRELYEQMFYDWNPDTGNELSVGAEFALED